MSRRRAGISPSLFPFLAVLICTLGTLILLLALVAQEAHDAAVAQVEQEQEQEQLASAKLAAPSTPKDNDDDAAQLTAAEATRLIDEGQFRVNELVSYRDQQTGELERKRDEMAQVEAHMRKIKEQIAQLKREVETATAEQDAPDESIESNEKTILLMREKAEKLRAEIAELESSERGGKPRVVIVPHRGPNGTQRRPVYVLCTAEGLQVMPEGAEISKADALAAAEADHPNGNPLEAALGVARLHAMQKYGDQVPPYPLLIVRPDGIYMYRVASALMEDWDDQYGYELVPGEVDLAFPGGDQVLRREMDLAIQETVRRNEVLARRSGGGSGRGGGGGNGTGDAGAPGRARTNQFAAAADAGGSQASGAGTGDSQQSSSRPGRGSSQGSQASGGSQAERELPTLSARDLDRKAQSNGFSLARDQRFNSQANAYPGPPGMGAGSYSAAGGLETQSEALNDFLQGKTPPGLRDSGPSGGSEAGEPAGGAASDTTNGFAGANAAINGPSGDAGESGSGGSGQSSSASQAHSANSANSANSASQANSAASPSAQGINSIAMTLRDAGPSGAPSSASNQPSAGQPGSSASTPDTQSPPQQSQNAAQVAQKMVRREGQNWAMPEAFRGMGGTEFIRPISMRCRHDRYELIERGRVVQTFTFGQDGVYQPTLQLATAIRDRVQAWGATMQGGYWKPQLDVSVGPHAEQRFHELQTLMKDSGVDVVRRAP